MVNDSELSMLGVAAGEGVSMCWSHSGQKRVLVGEEQPQAVCDSSQTILQFADVAVVSVRP